MSDFETESSQFSGTGVSGIPAIIVYACFHTALSEELFFRGFLLKRIAGKFGFWSGNIVQAILFGVIHAVAFLQATGGMMAVVLFIFTGGIAISLGYINEKMADGSILPSWCIHAITNIVTALQMAF